MSPLYEALCDLAKARDERNAAARPASGAPVMRAALERVAGLTLSQFMGPNDMALECVNVAQAALAAGVPTFAVRDATRQLRKALGISQDFDDWPLEKLLLKAAERIVAAGVKCPQTICPRRETLQCGVIPGSSPMRVAPGLMTVKWCPMNNEPCADSPKESRCGGCANICLTRAAGYLNHG